MTIHSQLDSNPLPGPISWTRAIACCGLLLIVGYGLFQYIWTIERRRRQDTVLLDHANLNPPRARADDPDLPEVVSPDEERCREITRLHGRVADLNWEIVNPLKSYDQGAIDAAELRRKTAEPETKILALASKMFEQAGKLNDRELREKMMKFSGAILLRQKGLKMVIEGAVAKDDEMIAEGNKLFQEGRSAVLEHALEVAPTAPGAEHVRRLKETLDSTQE